MAADSPDSAVGGVHGRWWWLAPVLASGVLVVALMANAWSLASAAAAKPVPGCPCNAPQDDRVLGLVAGTAGTLLLAGLMASLLAYWAPRRERHTSLVLLSVSTMVVTTVLLAGATYLPLAGEQAPLLVATAGVTELFLGSVDTSQFGNPPYPVGLQVARVLAVAATGSSLIVSATAIWQTQFERLRVRFNGDMDVVVGLNADTVPLVRALVQESRRWTRRETWHSVWPPTRSDLRRMFSGRPRVYVVADAYSEPMAALARLEGARVVVGDPTDVQMMRRLLLRVWPGRRVALRRLYLLNADQQVNQRLCATAEGVMRGRGLSQHGRDVVPRIIVRMDDAREVRTWRANNLGGVAPGDPEASPEDSWFKDAVSADELVAARIVEEAVELDVERLVLLGDSPLTLAILDELEWQRWKRLELCAAAAARPDSERDDSWMRSARTRLRATEVFLLAPAAKELKEEWEGTRASWGTGFGPFGHEAADPASVVSVRPEPVPDDRAAEVWVSQQGDGLSQEADEPPRRTLLVVTEQRDGYLNLARRRSRLSKDLFVLVPDPDVQDVVPPQPGTNSIGRFGVSWVRRGRGRTSGAVYALEDSWTELARQQHNFYLHRHGAAEPTTTPATKVTGWPWTVGPAGPADLPDFFREDNLRQLRLVVKLLSPERCRWAYLSPDADPVELTDDHIKQVAELEHDRWQRLRKSYGWQAKPTLVTRWTHRSRLSANGRETRDDWLRINGMICDWEGFGGKDGDIELVRSLVTRLRATGFQVVLGPGWYRYRRAGEATATRLVEPFSWTTETGETLTVGAGGWRVEDAAGGVRGVAEDQFPELYEQVHGDRYRRRGEVHARRVAEDELVETLEGPATARVGDWVVHDGSHQWPVPHDVFVKGYRKVRPRP